MPDIDKYLTAFEKRSGGNYFEDVKNRVAELDALAAPYLKGRPNKSLRDLHRENTELGYKWFEEAGEDWNKVPEAVAQIADGSTPYGEDFIHSSGSLLHSIGMSLDSLEAHAWQLNDFLKHKTDTPELPFEIVAKM